MIKSEGKESGKNVQKREREYIAYLLWRRSCFVELCALWAQSAL